MTKTKTLGIVIIILLLLTTPTLAFNLNPTLRQFTQPDTVIADTYNPQNLNRYSYVLNNPYKYVDPDGENPLLLFSAIGGVLGAGYGMISQIWHGASMFDNSMDWGSVGTSALIGTGAGLASGAGVAAVSGGVFGGTIGGVTGFVTGQAMSNVVSGSPVYDSVGMAGVMGAAAGSVLGGVGRIFNRAPSSGRNIIGTNYNAFKPTQEFISPKYVQDKINLIGSGHKPQVRVSWFGNEGPYLTDGQHSFVAYNLKGVPVSEMRISQAYFTEADKTLPPFSDMKFQENWLKVISKHIKELEK